MRLLHRYPFRLSSVARVLENYLGRRTCGKDADAGTKSAGELQPIAAGPERGGQGSVLRQGKARQGRGLQLRCPRGWQVAQALVSAKVRVPQTLRPPREASHLCAFVVISSRLLSTATASHRAPSPSLLLHPPNCIVSRHCSLCCQHALFRLSHCAASRRQQQIHRQGRCPRRLRLVERGPGPSRESIARAPVWLLPS